MDPDTHDNFQCPSNTYANPTVGPASAAERARVLFNHVRASSKCDPANEISCGIDSNFQQEYFSASDPRDENDQSRSHVLRSSFSDDASPQLAANKIGQTSDKRKNANWLDVLKVRSRRIFHQTLSSQHKEQDEL